MKNVEFCETKAAIKNLKTLLLYNVISIFPIVTRKLHHDKIAERFRLLALNQRSLHAHRISAKQKSPDRKMEGSLCRAEVERRLHLIEFPPSSRSLVPLSLTYICASLGKKPLLAGKSDLFVNGWRYRRVVKFRMEIGFQRTGTARIFVRERAAHLCASAASTSSSSSSLSFSLSSFTPSQGSVS